MIRIVPRITETDGLGHISNTTVPIWLEQARRDFFEEFNKGLKFENFRLLLVNTNISYKREIFVEDAVEVESYVKSYGNTSIVFTEVIRQLGEVCVEAETVYVNVDTKTHLKKMLNEDDITIIKKYKRGDLGHGENQSSY